MTPAPVESSEEIGAGSFPMGMDKISRLSIWIMIAGALLIFAPVLADPYQITRLIFPALGTLPILLMKKDKASLMGTSMVMALILAATCAVLGHDGWYSLFGSYFYPTDSILAMVLYASIAVAAARSGACAGEMARMIVLASLPVSGYAIFQAFFADPLLYGGLSAVGNRVVSTQGGPVFLGAALAPILICAIWMARRGSRLGILGACLGFTALYFTGTRGALLATAAGAALLLPKKIWIPCGIASVIAMAPRLISTQSDMARIEVWRIALRSFLENPMTGYGPGNFLLAFRRYQDWRFVDVMNSANHVQAHAHNDILHVMATMGILGILAYLLVARSALRVAQEAQEDERPLLKASMLCYFVLAFNNPTTTATYVLLALLFGAASARFDVSRRRFIPALACALIALMFGRFALASWHYARAVRANEKGDSFKTAVEFNRAAQLHPWEIVYTCKQVDSLIGMMGVAAPGNLPTMVDAALSITDRALRWHTADSYAHELRGKVEVVAYQRGFGGNPAASLGRFNRAQELAPTFEVLMWRRRAMALALHDDAQISQVESDLADLRRAISKEGT